MSRKFIEKSLSTQDRHIFEMRVKKSDVIEEIRNFCLDDYTGNISTYIIYDVEYNSYLNLSMKRVESLLERWESFCELFPHFNAVNSMDTLENLRINEAFHFRISLLYMWYNSLRDLRNKINEVIFFFCMF